MDKILIVAQLVIALGILNVWVLRLERPSPWRGGAARSMKEEFQAYGLPMWFMRIVGSLKVTFALFLLAGIWEPAFTRPAASGLALLMLGAVFMHFKVNDPPRRSLPAASILALCVLTAVA